MHATKPLSTPSLPLRCEWRDCASAFVTHESLVAHVLSAHLSPLASTAPTSAGREAAPATSSDLLTHLAALIEPLANTGGATTRQYGAAQEPIARTVLNMLASVAALNASSQQPGSAPHTVRALATRPSHAHSHSNRSHGVSHPHAHHTRVRHHHHPYGAARAQAAAVEAAMQREGHTVPQISSGLPSSSGSTPVGARGSDAGEPPRKRKRVATLTSTPPSPASLLEQPFALMQDFDIAGSVGGNRSGPKEATPASGFALSPSTPLSPAVSVAETDAPSSPSVHPCSWRGCQAIFDTTAALMEHLSTVHVGAGKARYTCEWEGCDRSTATVCPASVQYQDLDEQAAEEHFEKMRDARDDKGVFRQRQKVMRHLQMHTGTLVRHVSAASINTALSCRPRQSLKLRDFADLPVSRFR